MAHPRGEAAIHADAEPERVSGAKETSSRRAPGRAGPRVLAAGVTIAVCAAVVAFFVGRGLRSPSQIAAASRPPSPSLITAPIHRDSTPIAALLRGTLLASAHTAVSAPSDLGGDLPVVTAAPAATGSEARNGTVLMGVAGEPVIALTGAVPAYRTMAYGDSGPDVRELQSALEALGLSVGNDPSGQYGLGTANAVAELYQDSGYTPVTAPVAISTTNSKGEPKAKREHLATVPLGQAVFLPDLPAQVTKAPRIGQRLTPTATAIELGSGQLSISLRVNSNLAGLLKVGNRGRATSDLSSAWFTGRIEHVAKVKQSLDSIAAPQYDVTFVPVKETNAARLLGQSLAVRIALHAQSTGKLVVPVAAVVTNAAGRSSVIIVRHGKQLEVAVRPIISYGGSEVITPIGNRLHAGEQVIVGTNGS